MKDQTPEICLEAVRTNGYAIQYVKERTPEICLAAVKQNGLVLQLIPEQAQTLPIALAALKQNPDSWIYLADKFRTSKVYKAAKRDYEPEDLAPSRNGRKRGRTEERH